MNERAITSEILSECTLQILLINSSSVFFLLKQFFFLLNILVWFDIFYSSQTLWWRRIKTDVLLKSGNYNWKYFKMLLHFLQNPDKKELQLGNSVVKSTLLFSFFLCIFEILMSPLIKQILTLDKNNPHKYKIVNEHETFFLLVVSKPTWPCVKKDSW